MSGKYVLITGALGGIGKAIAKQLAYEGYNLILHMRQKDDRFDLIKKELEEYNIDIIAAEGDISKWEDCKKMVDDILTKTNRIDILVNNAGITDDNFLIRMKAEDFQKVIETNLNSAFYLTKLVFTPMRKNRSGKIINMSSIVGIRGNAAQINYSASKAGMIGLTKSCAKEFALRNIKVNAIAPGFIESPMTDKLSDEIKENLLNQIPLKKFGKPEDIAHLVSFLASEKSDYITGQIFSVDGGMNI
ncbi:MAG: 3-oxoacyl-[acyl-carrier-protein] reductase [Tissierellia bacterium]|nr:3-oxoacyl-[acyl-carrier-protein] reductase [Tissierellia bacterium]